MLTTKADAAESKDLKPGMGLIRRLTNRWSCSMMLLRYFRLTIKIGIGQPKPSQHLVDCCYTGCICSALVGDNLSWEPVRFERTSEELCGCRLVPALRQHEITCRRYHKPFDSNNEPQKFATEPSDLARAVYSITRTLSLYLLSILTIN